VGSGHATLALRPDWQAQLQRCHQELGFGHVRFHATLSDDVGTLVREGKKLIYSFFNVDRIIDFLLRIGMRPFLELSFMPEALASGNTTVFHYRGNVTPPRDYREWDALIHKLIAHWVERYGVREVRKWFFEVWNEPNLKSFWTGSQRDYFKLYKVTARAIKSVDASLQVGGPATADNQWIPEFLSFCSHNSAPVDFVSTHHYPTDAFGKESTDTITQLEQTQPDVMREEVAKVQGEARGLPVYYTEWNCSSNPRDPLHDHPFSAAFATKIIMDGEGLVTGYSFWTFSDIFEENYFPSVPFHGGFGLLNIHGIAKPIYRAFQIMHSLGNARYSVEGKHRTVSCWAIAKDGEMTMLIANVGMPRHRIRRETVEVALRSATKPREATLRRIDDAHANPRRLWKTWGKPTYLTDAQIRKLEDASMMREEKISCRRNDGESRCSITLPPQSIAAVTFQFS
jgi:xylan 1,4-beta-xylosidase